MGLFSKKQPDMQDKNVQIFQQCYEKAIQGEAEAQCDLGNCYRYGTGTEQDYSKAIQWYSKAAVQGHPRAQFNMGVCYDGGLGVNRDAKTAAAWYYASARQGFMHAQFNLGGCYFTGKGVQQSYSEALKWFRLAAEQGDASAQQSVGIILLNGLGVESNPIEGVQWVTKAAEQGLSDAQYSMGICCEKGICDDPDGSAHWFLKAAKQNNNQAQYKMGQYYENGIDVHFDLIEAERWYQKSADNGNAQARYVVGVRYDSVPKDNGIKWCLEAAKKGDMNAQYRMGHRYEYKIGDDLREDLETSLYWYRLAAAQGDKWAAIKIDYITPIMQMLHDAESQSNPIEKLLYVLNKGNSFNAYTYGKLAEDTKQYEKAIESYQSAADMDCAMAKYRLGLCYETGRGVDMDIDEAVYWYKEAAKCGEKEAGVRLAKLSEYGY